MILLIDNYDSFVYNLYQFLAVEDPDVRLVRNDRITPEEALSMEPDAIVISPGPGKPSDAGVCIELIRQLAEDYQADGVLDVTLQTCHPYTVERDKMMRLCRDTIDIPYMAVETDTSDSDVAQLTTRIAAFIEML